MKFKKILAVVFVFVIFKGIDFSINQFSDYAANRYLGNKLMADMSAHEVKPLSDCIQKVSEKISDKQSFHRAVAVYKKVGVVSEVFKWVLIGVLCIALSRYVKI